MSKLQKSTKATVFVDYIPANQKRANTSIKRKVPI